MPFSNVKSHRFIALMVLIIILGIAFIPAQQLQAATTITVSTAAELIQAINNANSETGLYVGADTITLTADITLTAVDNATDHRNGLPTITSEIIIYGNGHTIQRSLTYTTCGPQPGNATEDFRILHVSVGGDLSLYNLTLANGCGNTIADWTAGGGGLFNRGTITTLTEVTFSGNTAGYGGGGGIFNIGTITSINNCTFSDNWVNVNGGGISNHNIIGTISNSTFSGNTADNNGGGLFNITTITSISNSTFSGNTADRGGGIHSWSGTIGTISNSTFSGNSAVVAAGGGFLNRGTTTALVNSTFSGNSAATTGDGLYNNGTITTLANTLLGNHTGVDCYDNSTIVSGTNNLIEANSGCPGVISSSDPNLAGLANNGGLTQTHALNTGSPAIDTGDSGNCQNTDQRGVPRPLDGDGTPNSPVAGDCDIGAYETGATPTYPTVQFASAGAVYNESDGTVSIPLTVSGAINFAGIAEVYVIDMGSGTATSGADYTAFPPTTVTIDCSSGTCPANANISLTITADAISPEPSETVDLRIVATNGFAVIGAQADFTATIQGDPPPATATPNPEPQIGVFDPAISKMGILHPGQVGVTGEQLEWITTVSNIGDAAGNNVVVTDTLVSELQIDSVDAPGATVNISGQTVTVTYPTINPGEVFQFSIWTTVLNGVTVENTACVADPTQATGEECATALSVSALPSTGELPDN